MSYASDQPRNVETILVVHSFGKRPVYSYTIAPNAPGTCTQSYYSSQRTWYLYSDTIAPNEPGICTVIL